MNALETCIPMIHRWIVNRTQAKESICRRSLEKYPLVALFILHVDFIPAAGGDLAHGLVAGCNLARVFRIGYGRINNRPVWVSVDKGQQHLGILVKGKVHSVVCPRIGLRHAKVR